MADSLETGNKSVPADLAVSTQPDIDKNYFSVSIKNLKLSKTYAVQFQWVYDDGKTSEWSPSYVVTTSNESAPAVPSSTVPATGSAGIPVTLSTFPTNAKRVDVYVIGGTYGIGKVVYSFSTAGTTIVATPAGTYQVELRSISPTGVTSTVGTTFTIIVTDPTANIQTPAASVTPSIPTSKSVLGAIQVTWDGKQANGTDQPYGFDAAKVYVGTTAGFTPSSSNQVDVFNFKNGQNIINIGVGTLVNGVAMTYGVDYFVKIATTNGTDTSTPVSATGNPQQIGKVGSGDIVSVIADQITTGTLSATSTITVGTTAGKHVKLAGTGDPLIIYGSGGVSNPVLSYNGNKLTIVGDGSFTGNISGASGTFTGSITGASGEFTGDLGASGGNFTVRSGIMTALAGTIGGWVINSQALKNLAVAYPNIMLDPSGAKIELRATSSNVSDTGNYIKMDTTAGLRIGNGSSPTFKVDIDGKMTATNAVIQRTVGGNVISLTDSGLQATYSTGSTTMGYDGTFRLFENSSNEFNYATQALVQVATNVSSAYLTPGGISFTKQSGLFGTKSGDFTIRLEGNYVYYGSTGVSGVFWGNAGTGLYTTYNISAANTFSWNTSQIGNVWQSGEFGGFRPLGVDPYGQQLLGPRMFSGSATTNAAINIDIDARYSPTTRVNGDFYFSTA
jgi:hypothetical protein